ncbi:MAG TPA: cytochrome b [Luteimonas sp.]|nr:cytochrome b [Luteimonas sp.]
MESKHGFNKPTLWLHWLVAATVLPMLAVGIYMSLAQAWSLYDLHKSVGLLVIPLLLARAAWRLKQGWPPPLGRRSAIEQGLARFTHWALLLGVLALPLTGMLYSGASGNGFAIFGVELMPSRPHPTEPHAVIAYSESLSILGETAHEWVGYGLVAVLLLHVAGAVKHHLVDRDGTLVRMLGRRI